MGNYNAIPKPYYLEVATGFSIPAYGAGLDPTNPEHFPAPESWGPMPGTETEEEVIWTAKPLDTLWRRVRELELNRFIQCVEQTTGEESSFIVFSVQEPYVCYRLAPVDDIDELVENALYETPYNPDKSVTVVVEKGMVTDVVIGAGLLEQVLDGGLQIHTLDLDFGGTLDTGGVRVTAPTHPYQERDGGPG